MKWLSIVGDGDLYFYGISLFFGIGRHYEFMYFALSQSIDIFFNNTMKGVLRGSRPMFDDPSVAIKESGWCAADFGSPSGHAMLTVQFSLTLYLFYKSEYDGFCRRQRVLSTLVTLLVVAYVFGVCAGRLYLGRHSVDQILIGFIQGGLNGYYIHYCFKPYMFDPLFKPGARQEGQDRVGMAFKAMKISLIAYVVVIVFTVAVWSYGEYVHTVPQYYYDSINTLCEKYKKAYAFHNFSMAFQGYVTFVPAIYFWNWIKERQAG
jgi:membrane-associated phospholipid phosphatase